MWAQDTIAMYAYAAASADASIVTPFTSPPTVAVHAMHGSATTPAFGGWAHKSAPAVITAGSHILPTIPEAVRTLSVSPLVSFDALLSTVTSSLSQLSSLSALSDLALSHLNCLNKQASLEKAAALWWLSRKLVGATGTALTAGFGLGASVGVLSVPRAWAAATMPNPVPVDPPDGRACEQIEGLTNQSRPRGAHARRDRSDYRGVT
jgi:hypothetical protein